MNSELKHLYLNLILYVWYVLQQYFIILLHYNSTYETYRHSSRLYTYIVLTNASSINNLYYIKHIRFALNLLSLPASEGILIILLIIIVFYCVGIELCIHQNNHYYILNSIINNITIKHQTIIDFKNSIQFLIYIITLNTYNL